jgi:HlyD family secretion protein
MDAKDWLKRRAWTIAGLGVALTVLGLQWGRVVGMVRSAEPVNTALASETPAAHGIRVEGRVVTYPGADVIVGTDVGGTLRALPVVEKMHVHKGDLIAEIDASEQRAALAEARARIAGADVDSKFFEVEQGRSEKLLASGAIAKAALDASEHERDAAKARAHEAAATAQRLATIVSKARIVAPIDGVVVDRLVEQGETLPAGAQLVRIADLSRTRIEAEVDEYDSGRVALGQEVAISAEGYVHTAWKGHIEEIPDSVTSRRLKPQDPGRPSDTRVLMVKIALDEPLPVKLGQRVEVEIKAPPAR